MLRSSVRSLQPLALTTPERELENIGPSNELPGKAKCVLSINLPSLETSPKRLTKA